MPENVAIKIVIDPSLVKYFEEGMNRRFIDCGTAEELTGFLAAVLNDSMHPIVSSKTSEQVIHFSYRLKPYTDPFSQVSVRRWTLQI